MSGPVDGPLPGWFPTHDSQPTTHNPPPLCGRRVQLVPMSVAAPVIPTAPAKATDRIRRALLGGHPIIYVQTWEESRVEAFMQHLAKTFLPAPVPCGMW